MTRFRHLGAALAACAIAALAAAGSTGAAPGPQPAGPPLDAARIQVKAFEYGFVMSRPSVRSGPLLAEYDNTGEDSHNLRIRRVRAPGRSKARPLRIKAVPSRGRVTQAFNLAPGVYNLYCSLPGHARLGMQAKLVVKARHG